MKSFIVLIRKSFLIKGNSEFTGRGAYEMHMDCSWEHLQEHARVVVQKLLDAELLEYAAITSKQITIQASRKEFGYYNQFIAERKSHGRNKRVGVLMTIPDL